MTTRPTVHGVGPVHRNIHIGIDGQLWKWKKGRGQITVAASGEQAVQYARDHSWPEYLIDLLGSKGYSRVK